MASEALPPMEPPGMAAVPPRVSGLPPCTSAVPVRTESQVRYLGVMGRKMIGGPWVKQWSRSGDVS